MPTETQAQGPGETKWALAWLCPFFHLFILGPFVSSQPGPQEATRSHVQDPTVSPRTGNLRFQAADLWEQQGCAGVDRSQPPAGD